MREAKTHTHTHRWGQYTVRQIEKKAGIETEKKKQAGRAGEANTQTKKKH